MEILQFYSKLHPISLNVQYSIILNSHPFLISLHRANRFSGHSLSPSSMPDAHELQYSIAQQFYIVQMLMHLYLINFLFFLYQIRPANYL